MCPFQRAAAARQRLFFFFFSPLPASPRLNVAPSEWQRQAGPASDHHTSEVMDVSGPPRGTAAAQMCRIRGFTAGRKQRGGASVALCFVAEQQDGTKDDCHQSPLASSTAALLREELSVASSLAGVIFCQFLFTLCASFLDENC